MLFIGGMSVWPVNDFHVNRVINPGSFTVAVFRLQTGRRKEPQCECVEV